MKVLQYDETETGPRIRKTLADKHGVALTLIEGDVGGTLTSAYTQPTIDLYYYTRPSNGQDLWLIEAQLYYPPDVVVYRGWVVDELPTKEQIREIVATDRQKEI